MRRRWFSLNDTTVASGGGGGGDVEAPEEISPSRRPFRFSPTRDCPCSVTIEDEDWETIEGKWTPGSGEVSTATENGIVQLNVAPVGPYKFTVSVTLPWDDTPYCTTAGARVTFNHPIVDGYVDEENYWYVTWYAYTVLANTVTPRYYYLVCDLGKVVSGVDTRLERVSSYRILPAGPGITSVSNGGTICVNDDHLVVLFDDYTIGTQSFTRESGVIRLKAMESPHWTLPEFAGTVIFHTYSLSHVYDATDCDCAGCPDCTPPCACDGGWGPTSFEVTVDGFAEGEGTSGCTSLNGTYECTISSWVSGHNGVLCGIYRTCTWRYGSTIAVHVGVFHSNETFDYHDDLTWMAAHPEFTHDGVTVKVLMAANKYAYFFDEEGSASFTACNTADLTLGEANVLDEDLYCDTTNASVSVVAVP